MFARTARAPETKVQNPRAGYHTDDGERRAAVSPESRAVRPKVPVPKVPWWTPPA